MSVDLTEQSSKDKSEGVSQIYLKAFPLRNINELQKIKDDVSKRVIVILRVTPLAQKDVDELKRAVEELYDFTVSIGGDIARLGEERIIITPPGVKIWRGLI
ncbi:MAG: cell division protein SepF [Nitrososphaerota archaeon]|nr:cell division protein SepF [Nitrososphaerales archaeon]MCX8191988.1 cell division protein SepF [Nitrososphaerales archaeon]MDW8044802.1 cell division protein SepF [Nitrososphaerota archaeon]